MVNVPLADNFAIRGAGAMTKREGFDYNSFTNRHVNDRDLWSTRLSAQWEPNDDLKANFVWQHFEENDRRSRTGKQLCTRDPGPDMVGRAAVHPYLRATSSDERRLGNACVSTCRSRWSPYH